MLRVTNVRDLFQFESHINGDAYNPSKCSISSSFCTSKNIWNLLKITPDDLVDEFAELCTDYCLKNGLLNEFVQEVISKEVARTKDVLVLFREDCFAMKVIHKVLFSECGLQYLHYLVTPIVHEILAIPYAIDVSVNSSLDTKDLERNVDTILKLADFFLEHFVNSFQYCPAIFREILASIQIEIQSQFGESKGPMVLDFLFFKFVCPALVNPKKFQIVDGGDEIPIHSIRSLVNFSKFLNDTTHNLSEKFEGSKFAKIRIFIQNSHVLLLAVLNNFLDPQEIQKATLESPSIDRLVRASQQKESEQKLLQFLNSILAKNQQIQTLPTQRELLLQQKIQPSLYYPNWKSIKTSGKIKSVAVKSKIVNFVQARAVSTAMKFKNWKQHNKV